MYIIGAGGHGKVVAEALMLNGPGDFCFIDEDRSKAKIFDKKILHSFPESFEAAIIAIGNNLTRKRIALTYAYSYATIIHPRANISPQVEIGEGTAVIAGATINIDTRIGRHVIINTNASVGHDCIIDDFVHIAPNAALAGNVHIGEGAHIGLGAAVIQGVSIGKWCIIGAGTVVLKDVPDGAMMVGNPARIIKQQVLIADI